MGEMLRIKMPSNAPAHRQQRPAQVPYLHFLFIIQTLLKIVSMLIQILIDRKGIFEKLILAGRLQLGSSQG